MITAEKILEQVGALDRESKEAFERTGHGTDCAVGIQQALKGCKPKLDIMLSLSALVPPEVLFGLGIELGYRLAQAESLEKMVSGDPATI